MGRSCPAHDIPKFDCSDCRRIGTVRQAAEDGHIEQAATVLVDILEPYVELVLNALHHPEALVTDQSTIGDFGLDDDELSTASTRLEETLSDTDYIYEVAQHLRGKPRE